MATRQIRSRKRESEVTAKKVTIRKTMPLTKTEKALRERAALDVTKSEVENYLGGSGGHFRI